MSFNIDCLVHGRVSPTAAFLKNIKIVNSYFVRTTFMAATNVVWYSASTAKMLLNSLLKHSIGITNVLDSRITPTFETIYNASKELFRVSVPNFEMVLYLARIKHKSCVLSGGIFKNPFQSFNEQYRWFSNIRNLQDWGSGRILLTRLFRFISCFFLILFSWNWLGIIYENGYPECFFKGFTTNSS